MRWSPFCPATCWPLSRRMLVVLSLALVGFFLVCLRTLVKATFRCCSGVVNRKYLWQRCVFKNACSLKPPSSSFGSIRTGLPHFVLKYMRVVSNVAGEWAPSCLHSHSISSVTWLGIMCPETKTHKFILSVLNWVPKRKCLCFSYPIGWHQTSIHPESCVKTHRTERNKDQRKYRPRVHFHWDTTTTNPQVNSYTVCWMVQGYKWATNLLYAQENIVEDVWRKRLFV